MLNSGFGWPYRYQNARQDDPNKLLREIKEAAHEWAAGYPLGGTMDQRAADKVYQLCEQYDNLKDN